ncbi:MAG: type VI secretion system tip protein VgrG, partial [Burkholderiaceae bacterium]|nr:type VI secretion system tip protein VgrG [Burkholderiaceae bacterium]
MKLFQGDTAALAALASLADDTRQHGRLLRQSFPDGDGPADALLLVNRLDAREGLSQDFRYVVEMLSDDAGLDPAELIGKRVTIELVRQDGTPRHFNGHIFEFRFVKTDGGFAFYEMVLSPWLAHLRLRQNSAGFYHLRVSELTARVFDDYPMRDWLVNVDHDPSTTYICQHNESDHNLLHRHWERLGWSYRYEHRADGHTLLLFDDTAGMPPPGGRTVEMRFHSAGGSREDDGVHQWRPRRKMGPAKVTLASFDFKNPRSALAGRDSPAAQGDAAPALEAYENTGVYGLLGLKTHAKCLLIIRRERAGLRRYVHLATGNYNTGTARTYTDIGLLTARPAIGADASSLFNLLTGYSAPAKWNSLIVAPLGLHEATLGLIARETEHVRQGRPARIVAKMNALVDEDVIEALYRASQAGVPISLMVRGICCLRPNVPGVSDNIEVRAIIDRYLEHGRIFHFANAGKDEVYISSADWMPRNFHRRVEAMVPIDDAAIRARLIDILNTQWSDNAKSWILEPNGTYSRAQMRPGQTPFRSQTRFIELTREKIKVADQAARPSSRFHMMPSAQRQPLEGKVPRTQRRRIR